MEDKNIKDDVMRDYTRDVRLYMSMFRLVSILLCIVVSLLIVGFVILSVHHQNKMTEANKYSAEKMAEISKYNADKIVEIMGQYDWQVEYEIETTNNDLYSGNVVVEK